MVSTSLPHDTTREDREPSPDAGRGSPFLCVAFEAERPLEAPSLHALAGIDVVLLGRARTADRGAERRLDGGEKVLSIAIPDQWMSGTHAAIRRVLGRWILEDSGSKNGTFVEGKLVHRAELADGDVIQLGHAFVVFRSFAPLQPHEPVDATVGEPGEPGLATLRPVLASQLAAAAKIAPSAVSVIIRGETGTGKEVVARALHRLSGRPGELTAVNCGALPDTLVESELFGYRKGAFSGAYEDRPGLVRAADRGTLFLDEVGDLPLGLQPALLRVLNESEVVPVGATKPMKVDLRVVAATHRDLDQMAARGEFRPDLLARLSGFTLTLPPLRERREDLGLLTAALLQRHLGARARQVTFSEPAARALFRHSWPQNIRELEKSLTVAAALADGGRIDLPHLPPALRDEGSHEDPTPAAQPRALTPGDEKKREELVGLLRENRGNITAVARLMGKARMQVQRWIKRFGIDPTSFRE